MFEVIRNRWPWIAAGVWLMFAIGLSTVMVIYRNIPTAAAAVASHWPEPMVDDQGYELLFFAHPQCPCTLSSSAELERLAMLIGRPVNMRAYLFTPTSLKSDHSKGVIRTTLERIPGMQVETDPEGLAARRFGVTTSGHVLLYSPEGELRFSGGITPGRGHEGGTAAQQALLAAASGERPQRDWPTFGCLIRLVERDGDG